MTTRLVRILSATAFVAVATQAHALDFTPVAARILSDPLYLPMQGDIFGSSLYRYDTATQHEFDSSGARTGSTRSDTNTLTQELEYGVTDDLALRMNWSYVPSRDVTHDPVTGASVERSSSGWADPEFGATYRLLDQRDQPLTLDLLVDYSPNAFPAKSATLNDDGTIARGGQLLDLGMALGHQTRDFTIAATFDAQYVGNRKTENQVTGDFTRSDSLWKYTAGLATQTRFTDRLSLNAGIAHTFSPNVDVENDSNGLEHIGYVGDSTNVNAALNYHFIPNQFVGSIEYVHTFDGNRRNVFAIAPLDNTEVRDANGDSIGVNLRYVFQ